MLGVQLIMAFSTTCVVYTENMKGVVAQLVVDQWSEHQQLKPGALELIHESCQFSLKASIAPIYDL